MDRYAAARDFTCVRKAVTHHRSPPLLFLSLLWRPVTSIPLDGSGMPRAPRCIRRDIIAGRRFARKPLFSPRESVSAFRGVVIQQNCAFPAADVTRVKVSSALRHAPNGVYRRIFHRTSREKSWRIDRTLGRYSTLSRDTKCHRIHDRGSVQVLVPSASTK